MMRNHLLNELLIGLIPRSVMVNIDLKISGMTCQNCVRHVKEAISEVSGVTSVDVSLENASAKVSSDSDLDRGALKTAVQEAGYAIVE